MSKSVLRPNLWRFGEILLPPWRKRVLIVEVWRAPVVLCGAPCGRVLNQDGSRKRRANLKIRYRTKLFSDTKKNKTEREFYQRLTKINRGKNEDMHWQTPLFRENIGKNENFLADFRRFGKNPLPDHQTKRYGG